MMVCVSLLSGSPKKGKKQRLPQFSQEVPPSQPVPRKPTHLHVHRPPYSHTHTHTFLLTHTLTKPSASPPLSVYRLCIVSPLLMLPSHPPLLKNPALSPGCSGSGGTQWSGEGGTDRTQSTLSMGPSRAWEKSQTSPQPSQTHSK